MIRLDEILKRINRVPEPSGPNSFQITIADFAKALKEVQPDISYIEYKNLTHDLAARMGRYADWIFIPNNFEWFVTSFIDATQPSKALIPFATGLECDWFDSKTSVEYHFQNKEYKLASNLFVDINMIEDIPVQGEYDLIVSALPLDKISEKSIPCQITEKCSKLLSNDGYCVFTFSKLITLRRGNLWLSDLEKEGLYCSAVFDMPMDSYAPLSRIESKIVVFSKNKPTKRFAGLIGDKDLAAKNVENFLKSTASENSPKLGVFVEGEIRCYSDYIKTIRLQNKYKTLAKAYNGDLLKINQIGEIYRPNRNDEFIESDNAVYVPQFERYTVVTDVAKFETKAKYYYQIKVNAEIMLPRFLAFMLNTEEGVSLRSFLYESSIVNHFDTEALENMEIPCPTLEQQSEYLKTYDQIEVLRVEVEMLKDSFQKTPASYKNVRKSIKEINNTGDKFTQWIETLPYPIATILKRYSVSDEADKKQEILFFYYEAYSIFQATILSAALNKNLIDCSTLNDVESSFFSQASFGNWVKMDRALSKLYLKNFNSQDGKKAVLACFKTEDDNLITLLCNKKTCNILENASNKRNLWKGHAGITSASSYKEHSDILDSMLHEFKESIKDLYERVRLIRPVNLSYVNGIFHNKVEILTGSNSIFKKETIESFKPLDSSKLYIQMLDTGEMLELPPYFILKNTPADVKNACYFYSRIEKGSTTYVSYHYEGKPEDIETGEVAFNHIKQLLTN